MLSGYRKLLLLPFLAPSVAYLEPANLDIPRALSDFGVDITDLPRITDNNTATDARCAIACSFLASLHGSQSVVHPNAAAFTNFTSSYFTQQQATVEPHCLFFPNQDSDLSSFVLLSRLTGCPFAVKSGGHGLFTGSSSSIGGITVALEKLNTIEVSDDRKTAIVGSGNIWTQVYTELEKYGLAAIGGRVSGIGVGGLTLGGGLSFLSNMHGWACDNVKAYEVVLASGQIVLADETSNTDLFWALRGGGNNFGIVTKFHYNLYDHGIMYAGYQVFEEEHFSAVHEAYDHQVTNCPSDPHAQGWLTWAYFNKTRIVLPELTYAKNESSPSIYEQYLELPNIHSTRNWTSLAAHTIRSWEIQPVNHRNVYHTITTEYSPEVNIFGRELFYEMITAFPVDEIRSLVPAYIQHPITTPQLRYMRNRGGNALGLNPDGPALQIHQFAIAWADEHDDEKMYRFIETFFDRLKEKAEEMGIMHRFLYMNYASMFQDVIAGYGEENKKRLIEVAEQYDPTGVFQTLQPGHFKLRGGPWRSVDEWVSAKKSGAKQDGSDAGNGSLWDKLKGRHDEL